MKKTFLIIASLSFVIASWADSGKKQVNEGLKLALWTAAEYAQCYQLSNILIDNDIFDEYTVLNAGREGKDHNECIEKVLNLLGERPDKSDMSQFKTILEAVKLVKL